MWEGRKSIWILKTQINGDFCTKNKKKRKRKET